MPKKEEKLNVQEELVLEEETFQEDTFEEEPLLDETGNPILFYNGPTIEKVEEWKSRFNEEVYLSEFDDDVFIWRPIFRNEYKSVMKVQNADAYYREERICDTCVLYPENYSFQDMRSGKAGIPSLLSELILEKSGFQVRTGSVKL